MLTALFGSTMTLTCSLIFLYPKIVNNMMLRFADAASTYHSKKSTIFEVVNRDNFPDFLQEVVSHLSLFGNSLARVDYHNLFLTTVHQLGILGSLLFFVVLLAPLVRIIANMKAIIGKPLVISSLIFLVIFFINETKFEFTRNSSYEQICWVVFAVIYSIVNRYLRQNPYGTET